MKEKLEHIWYYYKWYIVAAVCAVLLAVNFIGQKNAQEKYAHEIAVVTGTEIPEDLLEEIAARLWDGGPVRVNYYRYDAETMQAKDVDLFSAAAVQLANDLENRISCCYITDNPEILLEARTELSPAGDVSRFASLAELEEIQNFAVLVYNREDTTWIK